MASLPHRKKKKGVLMLWKLFFLILMSASAIKAQNEQLDIFVHNALDSNLALKLAEF